jgi:hypothetical protein
LQNNVIEKKNMHPSHSQKEQSTAGRFTNLFPVAAEMAQNQDVLSASDQSEKMIHSTNRLEIPTGVERIFHAPIFRSQALAAMDDGIPLLSTPALRAFVMAQKLPSHPSMYTQQQVQPVSENLQVQSSRDDKRDHIHLYGRVSFRKIAPNTKMNNHAFYGAGAVGSIAHYKAPDLNLKKMHHVKGAGARVSTIKQLTKDIERDRDKNLAKIAMETETKHALLANATAMEVTSSNPMDQPNSSMQVLQRYQHDLELQKIPSQPHLYRSKVIYTCMNGIMLAFIKMFDFAAWIARI